MLDSLKDEAASCKAGLIWQDTSHIARSAPSLTMFLSLAQIPEFAGGRMDYIILQKLQVLVTMVAWP